MLSSISVADVYMLMHAMPCRNCAFVNFTNISNAIKAIDGIKNKLDYANLCITHQCANPPRLGPQGGGHQTASGNTTVTATASSMGDEGAEGVLGAGDPSVCDQVKEEEEGLVLGDGAELDGVNGTN